MEPHQPGARCFFFIKLCRKVGLHLKLEFEMHFLALSIFCNVSSIGLALSLAILQSCLCQTCVASVVCIVLKGRVDKHLP